MKNKKLILPAAAVLLLLVLAIVFLFPADNNDGPLGMELLKNGDFSRLESNGLPEEWYTDAYIYTAGYTSYDVADGVVTITNHALNDARFAQWVSVEPDSLYCFSGLVRANAVQGLGANLSVDGVYVFSDSYFDTGDEWKEVKLYGRTGDRQTSVTLFARLGGYSGESMGSASFKNLSLVKVDSVPLGYTAHNWYQAAPAVEYEEDSQDAAAWPYLVLIAALFVAVCIWVSDNALDNGNELNKPALNPWLKTVFMLLIAAAARIAIAITVPGYGVDIGCFTAWANTMLDNGAADFYVSGIFCDYPPGYILVLGFLAWIGDVFGIGTTELLIKMPSIVCDVATAALIYAYARKYTSEKSAFTVSALYAFNPLTFISGAAWGQADSVMAMLIVLVVILALEKRWYAALPVYMLSVLMKPQALMFGPLGLLALIVHLIKERDKKLQRDVLIGIGLAAVTALVIILPFSVKQENPLWIFTLYSDTMGYYDSATVNACNLYFLFDKNWVNVDNLIAWYIRVAAMLLLMGGAAAAAIKEKCFGKQFFKEKKAALAAWGICAVCATVFSVVPMYFDTFGTLVIFFAVAGTAMLYISGKDIRHLPLLGAVLLLALCNFGVMMHERYLFASVALLALACITERDKRVYFLFAFVTANVFLNVGFVLDRGVRIGGVDGHLNAPAFGIESDSASLEYFVSAVNCLLTVYAVYTATMICCLNKPLVCENKRIANKISLPVAQKAEDRIIEPDGRLQRMNIKDWALMLGVTVIYAAVAFVNLGSTVSPQTMWQSGSFDEIVVLDLGETRTVNMLYFGGIHQVDSDFVVQMSDDGVNWSDEYQAEMSVGNCFKWQYVRESYEYDERISYYNTPLKLTGRYVMLSSRNIATSLYEVIFRDPDTQEIFPVSVIEGNGEALIDEQHTFEGEPGWYNSTYFDEIYHARTGYEHYLAMQGDYTYHPYETSHPPLGKVLMAFAISIFGMTPFGWRFAGTLAGVLMLPGMYMLAKWLTKRRIGAFLAMFLMATDLMHFTQTRIATIDSFVVLFIIWSYAFMIYYVRMDYWRVPLWKTLIPLALSGLFMGLSVASKWTGCYAGVGLAVLFFWSIWRRYCDYKYAERKVSAAKNLSRKERKVNCEGEDTKLLQMIEQEGIRRPVITMLCCLVFFVAVPLLVYYISYIPYFLPTHGITPYKVLQAAVGDYFKNGVVGGMLGYHGTPGLGMDHPFYSPWYEWPVIGKPMWYYSSSYHPDGYTQTIVALGNPVVWWGGLAALALVAALWCRRHITKRGIVVESASRDMRPAILLISFAAQYLPWVLVPRGTYIYHYFTAVPFIICCAALLFDYLFECKENKLRKAIAWGLVALLCMASLALFIAFYPYASGCMTNVRWLNAMQWFSGWIYY